MNWEMDLIFQLDSFIKLPWYAGSQLVFVDLHPPKKPDHSCKEKSSRDALEYETIQWDKINSFNSEIDNVRVCYLQIDI